MEPKTAKEPERQPDASEELKWQADDIEEPDWQAAVAGEPGEQSAASEEPGGQPGAEERDERQPNTAECEVRPEAGSLHRTRRVRKFNAGGWTEPEDDIALEWPLTFRVDGEEFATVLCTPTDLVDMSVGFLASEGAIRRMDDIADLSVDAKRGFADIRLKHKLSLGKDYYAKRLIGSCCGKSRQFYFHNDAKTAKTIMTRMTVPVGLIFDLMRQLQLASAEFRHTGGVHNAAICDYGGLIAARSDIGRHNALDKIYGYCLRTGTPAADKIIAFSGRLSSEVVLKTAKIGAGIILSNAAPTDLALDLADDLGITAVGFIRGGQLNVYTHPERIVEDTPARKEEP